MTTHRPDINGKGQALGGDRTTTGALLISYITHLGICEGRGFILRGDKTGTCPKCGKAGTVVEGDPDYTWDGIPMAVDRNMVSCGCPEGSNRIIAPQGPISATSNHSSNIPADPQLPSPQSLEKTASPPRFDLQFLLIDYRSNKPKSNLPYRITLETGEIHLGVSDKTGLTKAVFAHAPLKAIIEAPYYESAEPTELCTDTCKH